MSDSKDTDGAQVLYWPGKLFSADDLRRNWKNQRELVLIPGALLTPLAQDELRALGVRVTRREATARGDCKPNHNNGANGWGYLQEKPDPAVAAAAAAVERGGLGLTALTPPGNSPAYRIRTARAWVDKNAGAVLFCQDAALDCCLANKGGLRAAAASSAMQAGRALVALGANLIVVEVPGRTYFEIRQILRTAAGAGSPVCPPEVARVLLEIEGHAHR